MVISFQGARKHCYLFRGSGALAHSFGDLGGPA